MIDFDQLWEVSHKTSILKVLDYYNIEYIETGGERYKCICPFHDDHSPSLILYHHDNEQDDSFCCYVDNSAGDSFRFIQLMEGDFKSAWRVLCEINNIEDVEFDDFELLERQVKFDKPKEQELSVQSYNRQISALYRNYCQQNDNSEEAIKNADQRLKILDEILDNKPSPAEMRQFYLHELQLITLFTTSKF